MNFGLTDMQIKQISNILEVAGVQKAAIFGSRAKGNWRNNSDIDIAVWGQEINLGKLSAQLEELPMPYSFDVIDCRNITSPALREHIDRVGVVFYKRGAL